MVDSLDLELFLTQLYLSQLVIVSRDMVLGVEIDTIHIEHDLIKSIDLKIRPNEFHGRGTACDHQYPHSPQLGSGFCMPQIVRIIVRCISVNSAGPLKLLNN